MVDEKKKGIGLLLALKPKAPAESTADSPRRNAAQGVLDAIEAKDVDALDEALKTFADCCSDMDSMPPPAA